MMQGLEQLVNDPQRSQQLQDFANRYSQGDPTQGYSEQEAQQNFQQVAAKLPPQEFQASALQAFQQLDPQQRQELAELISQRAQQQGVSVPNANPGASDAGTLAQVVGGLHQQQPGLLTQLLGSGSGSPGSGGTGGGLFASPVAKAAIAGIAAMAAQRVLAGH